MSVSSLRANGTCDVGSSPFPHLFARRWRGLSALAGCTCRCSHCVPTRSCIRAWLPFGTLARSGPAGVCARLTAHLCACGGSPSSLRPLLPAPLLLPVPLRARLSCATTMRSTRPPSRGTSRASCHRTMRPGEGGHSLLPRDTPSRIAAFPMPLPCTSRSRTRCFADAHSRA